jgi:hypothetical protein
LAAKHRFRHADQSPRRSIERLRPIGHVFLVCLIGAAEDATDHFVEHNESGVGENRFDLASKDTRVANRRWVSNRERC